MSNPKLKILVDSFRKNHKSAISSFYKEQREVFLKWAKSRYDLNEATILDVYQDSIIVFYQNAIHNKLDHVQGPPEGYLFGIARNLLLKRNKKEKRTMYVDDMNDTVEKNIDFKLDFNLAIDNSDVLEKAMGQLKENCRKVIKLYYYNNYSMDAIREEMGYENKDVAKSRKYQCLKSLRKLIRNQNDK